jgi:hypothetical protein
LSHLVGDPEDISMHSVVMRARRGGILAVLILLLVACYPNPLAAQDKIVGRLPSNTIFYLEWHGSAAVLPDLAKNHVLQLVFDPHLAPMWAGLTQQMQSSGQNAGSSPAQGAAAQPKKPAMVLEFPDILSLLSNPLVAGAVELRPRMTASATGKHPQPQHLGTFLVYDATGKADLIQKLKAANAKDGTWTSYSFQGTTIESRSTDTPTGTNTTYRAQTGNYYLIASEKTVMEDLVGRFSEYALASPSLGERPEFQEMRKYIGSGGAMEFFFRMPDFNKWVTAPGEPLGQILGGLHLEKIHAAGGSLSFAGEVTEMRGAMLGDASPASPFDFVGESRAGFVTEPLAKMGPAFSASRLNWAAGYEWLQGSLAGNLPPKPAASVMMAEAMAQAFLGMPIDDALKLFTGETASVTTYSEDGTSQNLYVAAIQRPEAVLRVLRAVGGKMIVAEDSSGTTTYLDLAYPYRDPVTGTQRRQFYYIAVSPSMMLVAERKAMLREAATLLASHPAGPAGVLANAEAQQLRTKLPEKLTGFSAADLTQIPWDKIAAKLATQAEQGSKAQNGSTTNSNASQAATWLKSMPPDVVSRHVHVSVGGSWKDANGVYFESYIQ